MDFSKKLNEAVKLNNSLLCVGLDPDYKRLKKSLFEFNKSIIDQTYKHVCAYKLQIAYYSAQGIRGIEDFKKTASYIKSTSKSPIICDAKRADIGQTSEKYAEEIFDFLEVDAVTVNPYLGFDSLEPFFKRADKGIFILCRTSNPGASDFQDLKIGKEPLYINIAKKVTKWQEKYPNIMMVVGATWPNELKKIRKIAKTMTFLVPGIGTQGGDLKGTLVNGLTKDKKGLIISVSRSIIYVEDPGSSAQKLKDEINKYR